ncbi:MAG: hypothetical protein ABWZ86_04705 [Hyphomicrobium sp.]
MPSRSFASPKRAPTSTVSGALANSARGLILFSALLAAATFAALSATAHVPLLSASPLQLAALTAVATLVLGAALVSIRAVLNSSPDAQSRARGQSEPPVSEIENEPLLADAADEASVSLPPVADVSIARSASQAPSARAFVEIEALAAHLRAPRNVSGGYRTLVTAESDDVAVSDDAFQLAKTLASNGVQTILVDWSPSGRNFAGKGVSNAPAGLNDLLAGKARFEDIIQSLPGTRAHTIASGNAIHNGLASIDPELLNIVLDALDEAYEHIVVVARRDEACQLFEYIEGRFDAGITVAPHGSERPPEGDNAFLGFEVSDIDILHYRSEPVASPLADRISRATRPRDPIAKRA